MYHDVAMGETLVQIGAQIGAQTGERRRAGGEAPVKRREPRPEWLRIRLRTPEKYQRVKRLVSELSLNTVCDEAALPEHLRVLGRARHRDLHDPGRHLHAALRLLRRQDRPAADWRRTRRSPSTWRTRSRPWACATRSSPRSTATTCRTAAPRHFRDTIDAVHRRVAGLRGRGADPGLPGRRRRARRGARSARPRSSPTTWRRCRACTGRRARARATSAASRCSRTAAPAARRGRVPGADQDRDHARARRDRRRGALDDAATSASAGVEVLAIGQYLQPTKEHLPVERFVPPEEFDALPRLRPLARLPPLRGGAAGALELPRARARPGVDAARLRGELSRRLTGLRAAG